MKTHAKQTGLTILSDAVITAIYFFVLTRLFEPIAVARYYFAIWGFAPYVLLLSLAGFLLTFKSTRKLSLICAIGIPALIVLAFFIFNMCSPDFIRIPLFNQYGEYQIGRASCRERV